MIYKKIISFTLIELLVVLSVIGIILAVILPLGTASMPDENVLKFKKAHNLLGTVITELVTSDKYYCNGDLGIMADCNTEITNGAKTLDYFCLTIADLLSTKSVNCSKLNSSSTKEAYYLLSAEKATSFANGVKKKRNVTQSTIQTTKLFFDSLCKERAKLIGEEIVTTDNIAYYNAGSTTFGTSQIEPNATNGLTQTAYLRYFSPPGEFPANYSDQNGNDIAYKIFCIDIDGIPDNATGTNCVNECPFGYGIRADGKILNGARAEEWLKKEVREKE